MKRRTNELLRGGRNSDVRVYNSKRELIRVETVHGKVKEIVRR